jgi:hypothetical protein
MIQRLLLVGLAAVFGVACASSAQKTSATAGSASAGSDIVSVSIKLSPHTDALSMFQLGADAKGTCRAERGQQDGLDILRISCANQAGILVAQRGPDLLLACNADHYTEQGCRNYALDLLAYAQRSASR